MKLYLELNNLAVNPTQFMRQAGYAYLPGHDGGSFVKTFGRSFYPRFHVYIEEATGQAVINLHLDQKQPGYSGQSRHNGEYDGPVVAAEIARLEGLKRALAKPIVTQQDGGQQSGGWLSRLFK